MDEYSVFTAALDQCVPEERLAYIERICSSDPALKARVLALLRTHDDADDFLTVPAMEQITPAGMLGAESFGTESSASEAAPEAIDRLGKFKITGVLGQGGMGTVYEAVDETLERPVALKILSKSLRSDGASRDRFLREARMLAAVSDERVVKIHEVAVIDDLPLIAMELLEGESLQARIDREGSLSVAQVLELGRNTALGLLALHEKGLIHRDITPANLLITKKKRFKLLDLGLARPIARPDGTTAVCVPLTTPEVTLTKESTLAGTPHYMAPEQLRKEGASPQSDLYSLGCVTYRLLTGEFYAPETGISALGSTSANRKAKIPAKLVELVAKLLEPIPANRPPSALQVAAEFEAISRAENLRTLTRWAGVALGAGVLLVLVVYVLAGWLTPATPEGRLLTYSINDQRLVLQDDCAVGSHYVVHGTARLPRGFTAYLAVTSDGKTWLKPGELTITGAGNWSHEVREQARVYSLALIAAAPGKAHEEVAAWFARGAAENNWQPLPPQLVHRLVKLHEVKNLHRD